VTLDLNGKRLLLIKPSALGDVAQAAASAWALKARWPGMHLTWMINAGLEALIKPLSCLDATLPFARHRFRGFSAPVKGPLRGFVRTLRQGRYDAVLDMQGLFRSGLFAWLSRAKVRVGQRNAREFAPLFYTRKVDVPPQPVHAKERYNALTAALDCAPPTRHDLDVTEAEREAARARLAAEGFEGGPLVVVCPGARWESKIWPARHMADALDRLARDAGATRPVVIGSDDARAECEAVTRACRGARPLNLCGGTGLRELAALLDVADLMLTCDSGPMHVAAAQGTPVVAVLGPTDPRRTGPYGQLDNVVKGQCELMPCLKRRCPGLGQKCLRDLPGEAAATRALALLAVRGDKTTGARA
jgi:heptosyltransferase I